MQNLTAQKVCLALITLGFFIAAPWMTSQTISGNTVPLLSFLGVGLLLILLFLVRERCWMIIPFTLPVEGNLNFLPVNFSIQELSIMGIFAFLLYRMIFGLNVVWRLGQPLIWIPLALLLSIIVYHWVESRDIGIKLLGGTGWGGRKYFTVMIASFGMLLLNSFPGITWADLQKVPILYFLGSFVDIVPDALTTLIPGTAPYIWKVYSNVNLTQYGTILKGNFSGEEGISRILTLSKIGNACALVVLCYNPTRVWLSPTRFWIIPALLVSILLTAAAGFRNMVVRLFIASFAAIYATARSATFLIAIVGFLVVSGLVLLQGRVFSLPLAMQRALSFLPGEWDAKAAKEAKGSSEWRRQIKTLFYKEYFNKAPWIGQGYHYDPNLAKAATDVYQAILQQRGSIGDEYSDVRGFIEMRQPHEGPIHALLVSGSIGAFFFCTFCFGSIFFAWRSVVNTPPQKMTPIQIWAFAILISQLFAFVFLFGDYTSFLIQVCPVTALIYRAETLRRAALKSRPPLAPTQTSYPPATLSPQA